MNLRRNSVLAWAFLMGLCCSPTAVADSVGEASEIVSVSLSSDGSDEFSAYKGTLILRQLSDGQDQEFRWGGAACPGKDLTEPQVSILFDLAAAPYMLLTPRHKPGAGQNVCLVGFRASNRKFL